MVELAERARRYLATLPPAVSGQGGHDAAFRAACTLVHGFAFEPAAALDLLRQWNAQCLPPWSEAELRHKVVSAAARPLTRPRGHLVGSGEVPHRGATWHRPVAPPPRPVYEPARLQALAAKLPEPVSADWLRARSPVRPDAQNATSFLHRLYRPGETVLVFTDQRAPGRPWRHQGVPYDADELAGFETGQAAGVWFLPQPVDGVARPNDTGTLSRRSRQNVTAWRYLLLETDAAPADLWLAALVQMPLPISSITTSGGRSIHALVRVDAASKEAWDGAVAPLKPAMTVLGADPRAMTAVRLSRLPCCERLERGARQELLYLDPDADGRPIWKPSPP